MIDLSMLGSSQESLAKDVRAVNPNLQDSLFKLSKWSSSKNPKIQSSHLSIGLDTVLEAVELPAGVTDLDTSLSDVNWNALSHLFRFDLFPKC